MQFSIVKNFCLIGGVQIFRMGTNLVLNKILSLCLGVSGFGVWSLYLTTSELGTTFANFALPESGIRKIAEIAATDNTVLPYILWVYIRLLVLFAVISAVMGIIFSDFLSTTLFNSSDYQMGIIIVCLSIIFSALSKGIIAVFNGLRELKSYMYAQFFGCSVALLTSIGMVFIFRKSSILPLILLCNALILLIGCGYFYLKLPIHEKRPDFRYFLSLSKPILSVCLGLFLSNLTSVIMMYCSKAYLAREFDYQTVGIYQACWSVSGLYVGLLIASMGVDFIPRVMQVIGNNRILNQLVNDQLEFSALLSCLGIVGVLSFCEIILDLLYSSEFVSGVKIIRWQILGVALRVFAFPFTYSLIAKGKSLFYFIVQAFFWIGEFLLLVLFSKIWGFDGLGINYCVGYAGYAALVIYSGHRYFNFQPSRRLIKIFIFQWSCIVFAWCNSQFLPKIVSYPTALILLALMCYRIEHIFRIDMGISIYDMIQKKLKKVNI